MANSQWFTHESRYKVDQLVYLAKYHILQHFRTHKQSWKTTFHCIDTEHLQFQSSFQQSLPQSAVHVL